MGDLKADNLSGSDRTGETRLRDGALSNDERRTDVAGAARQQSEDTDQVLRTDGEEDSLYDDGLELENHARPLTGVNGKDDS